MFVCNLSSHSETVRGKSLWIHQRKQKNYPWHSQNQVVGFINGSSNHKNNPASWEAANGKNRKLWHTLSIFFLCYFALIAPHGPTQSLPKTTVFCKISVRKSKQGLQFSIGLGRLQISCTIFEACLIVFLRLSKLYFFTFHSPSWAVFRRERKPKIFRFKNVTEGGK